MNRRMVSTLLILTVLICVAPDHAFAARDLTSAASSAVSQATTIAKAISVLGILCGAIAYQIPGATMFARGTIMGGLIGAGLSFGGPSLLSMFQAVFGG